MIYVKDLLPPYDEAWADLLMADTKDGITHAVALMGLRFRGNPLKRQMAYAIAQYVKETPEKVIRKLDITSLTHLKQLLEAGKGQHIVVKDLTQPGMLQQMLLVMTCANAREGTCLCMLDELHDAFAPNLALIESLLPPEHIRQAVAEIMKQGPVPVEDDKTADEGEDMEEDDWEDEDSSGYCCAPPLMEDVRKLPYNLQAQVCKAFHLFIRKTDWTEDYMIERFGQTYRHIKFNQLEECVRWVRFCVNDLDNAISQIDYNDPMTFFLLAAKLEPIIREGKGE